MTVKYRRLRIVKHRKGQIHDEDVARWRLEVPEQAAVALAQQVGYGQAVLPPTAHPPLLSPQPAHNALDYANLLPPDVRHAVFRHCEMMARHQRLLLEGQERLKYVQAQIREMKARLPPPPPPRPVAGMNRTAKGPDVPPHQVRSPSCWASCCGLAPLPPPPLPPTEAGGPGGGPGGGGGPLAPVALELPPPDYFAQAALATALAQSRRQTLEAQAEQEDYQHALSAGGASLASSGGGVRPFTSSGGGGAVLTTAAMGRSGRRDATGHDPSDNLVAAGDLPGQMDRRRGSSAGGGGGGSGVADGVAGGPLGGGRPAMAPLQGRAPGTPQSLLRPLASYGAPGAGAGPGAGGGSAPRKVLLPAMRASQAGAAAAAAAAAGGPGGGGTAAADPAASAASSYDLSRYQDPESLRKITAIQAAQRGRVARKRVAGMRAPTAAAAPQSRAAPPPASSYDLSRYQDPATLKKITTIQAAQRGRAARKQVAGMRSQQQPQQQPVAVAGPGPSAHPFDLPPLSQSRAMAPLPPGLPGRAKLAAPPVDVTPQPLKEEQAAAARLAAAQAAAADDEMALLEASLAAGVVEVAAPGPGRGPSLATAAAGAPRQQAPRDHDLSRYQDPESLRKITAIQAAQRGRVVRKQVAEMRSAAPPPPPPPAAAPQSRAAPPPASSYDLSRYQDPATLKKITTIQAAQRGRVARKQVAGMKGAK